VTAADNEDRERVRVAGQWLALVCELLAGREYEKAGHAAACAVIDYPFDGRFWELGGVACWMSGETQASVLCLEEATTLKPLQPFSQVALADGYERVRKKGLARTIWEFLAGPVGGPRLVGLLDGRPGAIPDYHLAYTAYRTVTDHDPRNHYGWFGLGVSLARGGGDHERVADCYAVAVKLAPGVVSYRLNLAEAWVRAGDRHRAAEALARFDPDRFTCRCALGWAAELFDRIGDRGQAEACRRRIADLEKSI
jgi:tetratricopeptide (TPR) repeat protein